MKSINRYFNYVSAFLLLLIICLGCSRVQSNQGQLTEVISERTQSISLNPTDQGTPLQLIYPEDTEKEINRLMTTNNDCVGFCFWGIVPDKTNFQQAVLFFQTITEKKNTNSQSDLTEYSSSFEFYENKIYAYVQFSNVLGSVDDFEVKIIGLGREDVPADTWLAFRPDNILRRSGSPDEIFIVMSQGPEGRLSYDMYFTYPEGYIFYSGNQTIILPDHIMTVCPNKSHNLDIFRFVADHKNVDLLPENGIVPIDQASLLSKGEVFTVLTSGEENACFDIDYDIYRYNAN